jgi:hypothetical protein
MALSGISSIAPPARANLGSSSPPTSSCKQQPPAASHPRHSTAPNLVAIDFTATTAVRLCFFAAGQRRCCSGVGVGEATGHLAGVPSGLRLATGAGGTERRSPDSVNSTKWARSIGRGSQLGWVLPKECQRVFGFSDFLSAKPSGSANL